MNRCKTMKYQNTLTGAIIDIKSEITEGPWQAVKPAIPSDDKNVAPAKRKAVKKKDG